MAFLCVLPGEKGVRVCDTHTPASPSSQHEFFHNDRLATPEELAVMRAAPDLLAALVALRTGRVAGLCKIDHGDGAHYMSCLYPIADAAIAKARVS